MHISPAQAIDVALNLRDAADGVNGFGGNTAEIYAYKLLPHRPSGSYDAEDYTNAARALGEIIYRLCKREDKKAFINDEKWYAWIEVNEAEFDHRVQVTFEDK